MPTADARLQLELDCDDGLRERIYRIKVLYINRSVIVQIYGKTLSGGQ